MVRKAMYILLRVTSENNERFSSPVIFKTFSNAAIQYNTILAN